MSSPGDEERKRCAVCGVPLRDSRRSEPTCGSLWCVQHLGRREPPTPREQRIEGDRVRTEREAEIGRRTLEHEGDLRARHGTAIPPRLIHARLPANEQATAPLPAERRAAFTTNLEAALDRAFESPDGEGPVSPETPTRLAALVQASCAACRGSCCKSGGDRAYLYPDHLRRYLREHPGKSKEQVLSEYLALLPAESCIDACVYQGPGGCALPRGMRANLCNTFLCGGLSAMLQAQTAEGALIPVLAVCVRDSSTEQVRSSLFDGEGKQLVQGT